jgi:hypothetical protein
VKRPLILALVLAGCSYDPGGGIAARAEAIRTDPSFRELPRWCASACTMEVVRGCVWPDSHFVLHTPSVDTPHWREVMARHYPPDLAAFFMALPQDAGAVAFTGSEVIAMGVRACQAVP